MKVGGIDYGRGTPWESEVPDDPVVIETTSEDRTPPPLEAVPAAVGEAIRAPLETKPLADQVPSNSKVPLAINDWMGVSVHAVPVVLDELREAGVDERNVRIVVA